ncbi:hypothetical protein Sliba_09730 [Streptomyces nigrescens]|uniref:Uncharacterized protein n=1 Tax=Streptomyces nigrescens TaxID=1920 RepID=A0A640TBE4_STRNI|nr:hypothetical protein Sliba_09730 [Streptomyces libani subsp. libani]GGV87293.1 hypothetical protein GCM10010500_07180 [Streptomyces libani subsp. libani]
MCARRADRQGDDEQRGDSGTEGEGEFSLLVHVNPFAEGGERGRHAKTGGPDAAAAPYVRLGEASLRGVDDARVHTDWSRLYSLTAYGQEVRGIGMAFPRRA